MLRVLLAFGTLPSSAYVDEYESLSVSNFHRNVTVSFPRNSLSPTEYAVIINTSDAQ